MAAAAPPARAEESEADSPEPDPAEGADDKKRKARRGPLEMAEHHLAKASGAFEKQKGVVANLKSRYQSPAEGTARATEISLALSGTSESKARCQSGSG